MGATWRMRIALPEEAARRAMNILADRFAELRAKLERDGTPIGVFDTMIAGHALALKATLVTNNRKHFQKVKALKIENWVEETRRAGP